MGREHRIAEVAGGELAGGAAVAPGKRSPTDRLPRTGVPAVDDGFLCERADVPNCFLSYDQRTRMYVVIASRGGIVAGNARDACADTRMDVMLENEETWGPFMELFYYGATGWAIGGIMRAIKGARATGDVAEAATAIAAAAPAYEKHLEAALTNASRAWRKSLQGSAKAAGSHRKASHARFVELVRDGVPLWVDALVMYAADLDDHALVALKDALDPALHPVSEFKAKLVDLLERFQSQQIDQVGVAPIYRQGELVYVGRGRRRRLVMMEDHGYRHTPQVADGAPTPRELVQKIGADGKPVVISPDLEPMAVAMFRERTGREPAVVDPEAAVAAGGELARIGGDLLVDMYTSLGGSP